MERVAQSQYYSDDNFKEKCGVFGVYGIDQAAEIVLQGLKALQHRGQDSAGIAGYKGSEYSRVAELGLVTQVFSNDNLRGIIANKAVGQVRYTTSQGLSKDHAQPVEIDIGNDEKLFLSHNGNIPDTRPLEKLLDSRNISYTYLNDTEMVGQVFGLFIRQGAKLVDAYWEMASRVPGVYSLAMLTPREMAAARCEYGVKPLSFGKIDNSYVVSSETIGLDAVNAEFIRDVTPGEFISFNENGLDAYQLFDPKYKLCIFEAIYFASPKSYLYGRVVEDYRIEFGRQLAREHKIFADVVFSLPDSGNFATKGYSEISGIPMEAGLIKNRAIDRTFITAGMDEKMAKAEAKYIPQKQLIDGRDTITVDDSQVHGTTDRVTVPLLRKNGASKVIVLKASPCYRFSNHYGTNTSYQPDLASYGRTEEELRDWIGAEYLGFLSLEGMKKTLGKYRDMFDFSVFDGNYPVPIGERAKEIVYPQKELASV
ncbi:hypothetical protein A3F00_03090 [Candidatus Daviesbacteria bacterium RIFCSPHIGHO2_12_FULL_37_11]|uniref:Amidophosphoribosyltransferase n=1 Tax=Candidatus Daviesbacteria bacterium RIFCSPHIGHO2_12_FULL_37_11 TaxID=1797777 RepID=A0A1F5KBF7_9BACT|nr:MAG: hypothetical protein A2769_04380 [Candidatus Daviesbacteria bacterium RIFCSPHIGHO2_01_FULL_37_27]OGE38283.1 MAG: hypothetical protein A3F00_03090 [Candidatus Daviesbacteria bacterium RIFCSPHIGHO2_12_FULL_37_11]